MATTQRITTIWFFWFFSCLFTFYGCSKSEFLTKDPTSGFEKTKCLWTKIALLVVSKSINIWIFIISWKKSGATIFEAILHPQIMQVCGGQNSLKSCRPKLFSTDSENLDVNWFLDDWQSHFWVKALGFYEASIWVWSNFELL